MPRLYLRLLDAARPLPGTDDAAEAAFDLDVQWCIREDDGSTRAHGRTDAGGLADLIDPAVDWLNDPANVVVFAPAAQVLAVSCSVPGRNAAQIRRALPFAVEEFVATEIENMHLASGPIRRGEPVRCNLVDSQVLEDWLSALGRLGLAPGYLLCEAELLPDAPDRVSLLFEGDSVLVKTAEQAASLDRENLMLALGGLTYRELLLVNGELTELELGQLDDDVEIIDGDTGGEGVLGYLMGRFESSPAGALNLLQGPYAPKRKATADWQRWQAVAGLAAVWILAGFVAMVAKGLWSSTQADRLQAESEALYRELFGAQSRIVNVRRQFQSALGGDDPQASSFTDYLGQLAQTLDRNSAVLSLTYTSTRDELAADMLVKGFEELEALKQGLEQRGVRVDITSAEQQDASVRARLRLGRS